MPSEIENRRSALQRYFWSPPTLRSPLALIVVVIVILLFLFFLSDALGGIVGFLIGFFAISIGILLTFAALAPATTNRLVRSLLAPKGRPSDAQVDRWINESTLRAIERSKALFGISNEEIIAAPTINSALVATPPPSSTAAGISDRMGEDGGVRAPTLRLRITWITARRIAVYQCLLDLIEDSLGSEGMREYSSAEIASVSIYGPHDSKPWGVDASRISEVNLEVRFKDGDVEQLRLPTRALDSGSSDGGSVLHLLRLTLHNR
jgi:hypothetical protein